jgi:hypothetical protein
LVIAGLLLLAGGFALENGVAMANEAATRVTIRQGLQARVGSAMVVGVTAMSHHEATISVTGVSTQEPNSRARVQMKVRAGDIVPLGAKLHQVFEVVETGESRTDAIGTGSGATSVGAPQGYIVLDGQGSDLPAATCPKPTRRTSSLLLPVGSTASATGYDIEVVSLSALAAEPGSGAGADQGSRSGVGGNPTATATFDVWPSAFAKPDTKVELVTRYVATAGDRLALGAQYVTVLCVVPPGQQPGRRGFVAIEL